MHIDDATAFLGDWMRNPRPTEYGSYGFEIYLRNVIADYLKETERVFDRDSPRSRELSPVFYEAAWDLCRHGVLRPGVKRMGLQSDGGVGDGYCVTALGRSWIEQGAPAFVVFEPSRLGKLFESLSPNLGRGFLQRANEAVQCHRFSAYLACCAMCGAAAEALLLAVAIQKTKNEAATLNMYKGQSGRRRVVNSIVAQLRQSIAGPFESATGLLSYWRDQTAHGTPSN